MSLIDCYLEWLALRCCDDSRTPGNRREILTRADTALPHGLEGALTEELVTWLYRPGLSPSTLFTYYGALASFYAWAFDPLDLWLDGPNPMLRMPPRPKLPKGVARPVTDEQLHRILTEARQPFRLWALIAAYQGLRCCEISRLDREHVTQQRLIVVRGKGGKARVHDTDPYVWAAVRDLPPGPIAIDPRTGQRATPYHVSVYSANHFRRDLHMPGCSLHRLRHWLGCTVQAAYRDTRVTQDVLGHESLSSTQIYTRATLEQQRAARSLLPRLA
jgi:integrase/recombinase XerC